MNRTLYVESSLGISHHLVHAILHVLDVLKGSVDARGVGNVFHEGSVS